MPNSRYVEGEYIPVTGFGFEKCYISIPQDSTETLYIYSQPFATSDVLFASNDPNETLNDPLFIFGETFDGWNIIYSTEIGLGFIENKWVYDGNG